MWHKILGIIILVSVILTLFLIMNEGENEIEIRKIDFNAYEQTINGFGKPDVIFTSGNIHSNDCENPVKPAYIKLSKYDNALRITDSLLKIRDYCCEKFREESKKKKINYLYQNIRKDSIISDMEIRFEDDKISNQIFRNKDTIIQKNKIPNKNSIF